MGWYLEGGKKVIQKGSKTKRGVIVKVDKIQHKINQNQTLSMDNNNYTHVRFFHVCILPVTHLSSLDAYKLLIGF